MNRALFVSAFVAISGSFAQADVVRFALDQDFPGYRELPFFDPSLGTLTKATLKFYARCTNDWMVYNNGSVPGAGNLLNGMSVAADFDPSPNGLTVPRLQLSATASNAKIRLGVGGSGPLSQTLTKAGVAVDITAYAADCSATSRRMVFFGILTPSSSFNTLSGTMYGFGPSSSWLVTYAVEYTYTPAG